MRVKRLMLVALAVLGIAVLAARAQSVAHVATAHITKTDRASWDSAKAPHGRKFGF